MEKLLLALVSISREFHAVGILSKLSIWYLGLRCNHERIYTTIKE